MASVVDESPFHFVEDDISILSSGSFDDLDLSALDNGSPEELDSWLADIELPPLYNGYNQDDLSDDYASKEVSEVVSSSKVMNQVGIVSPPSSPKPIRQRRPHKRRHSKGIPKRPLSAYNCFFKIARAEVVKETKGKATFENLGRLIGERWKNLGPKDRKKYERKAGADMKRYCREMKSFKEIRRMRIRGLGIPKLSCSPCPLESTPPPALPLNSSPWTPRERYSLSYREGYASHQQMPQPPRATSGFDLQETTSWYPPHPAPHFFYPPPPPPGANMGSPPPGMEFPHQDQMITVRNEHGQPQHFRVHYQCYRMKQSQLDEYLSKLSFKK